MEIRRERGLVGACKESPPAFPPFASARADGGEGRWLLAPRPTEARAEVGADGVHPVRMPRQDATPSGWQQEANV